MPSIVETQTSITRPIFLEWRKSNISAAYKKSLLKFTIFMVLLFAGILAWLLSQGIPPVMMAGELLFMLAIFLWVTLVLPRSKSKRQYKALCKAANGVPKRTVRFYPNHLDVITETGKTREFSYDKIHTLRETEHLYILVNESNLDIVIDKNGFVKGTIEQIREFLPEKCEIVSL